MRFKKTPKDCSTSVLVIVGVAIFALSLPSALAAQTKDHNDKPGHPWHGNPGITETIEQIMARESSTLEKKPKHVHEHHRHEAAEDEPPLQDNPLAPLVPQWPSANSSP